jgi:hypothetical protein
VTTMFETPPPAVRTSSREWDVRVRDDFVQVFIHDASTVERHDLDPGAPPRSWASISLRAEHARELALDLQDAAGKVEEDVLEEWGLGQGRPLRSLKCMAGGRPVQDQTPGHDVAEWAPVPAER